MCCQGSPPPCESSIQCQVVAQVGWFLHIDLSRQKREDLQLILFSTLILILMAGGTIWVLADLARRMTHLP